MRIKYSVSLWNYSHYANVPSLERIITLLREQGYGIELWGSWRGDKKDLFDEVGRRGLKQVLQGMTVSLHTAGANTFDLHKKQIEAAADLGAEVVVLHPSDFVSRDNSNLDVSLACKAVAYASEHGVRLALENGQLPFLANAIEKVEGLGICLDVGHVYLTSDPMSKFLDALKERIIHLHIQDVLSEAEDGLPCTGKDHYIPGSGGIPDKDWNLFATTLGEINFQGIAVFEIQPRNPLQTALLGRTFMRELLEM
jgi:sugar phosphate isomerase/epimerase